VLVLVTLAAGVIEGGSRAVLALRRMGQGKAGGALAREDYMMWDPRRPGLWVLRPGYQSDFDSFYEATRRAGRALATRFMDESVDLRERKGRPLIRVNAEGYRGPDLDAPHASTRILALGDSCTFGTMFEDYTYPRVLERELRRRGWAVEVVNAGVEGYAPREVRARLGEFKRLAPEITVLYVGWNGLFPETGLEEGAYRYLASARLLRSAWGVVRQRIVGIPQAALEAYQRPRHWRPVQDVRLDRYAPAFLSDVEAIVAEMKGAGSHVALVTIPGLYTSREPPSPRALEIGQLPRFTDNPFVLARMTERYNDELRVLADRTGVLLIDLERWSEGAFRPRDRYFFDSIHLYEQGQEAIGAHVAEELAAAWPELRVRPGPAAGPPLRTSSARGAP
jgi:lysophospholipase L1-like esterase